MSSQPLIFSDPAETPDGWNEPDGRGVISWKTLLSSDQTPSEQLSAGIVSLSSGGFLALHRHAPAEIYYIIEGEADVIIDGKTTSLKVGDTVYVPPFAEHGIRNSSNANCRFLFVFPTNSVAEIKYTFS